MKVKLFLLAVLLAVVVPCSLYRMAELLHPQKSPTEQTLQTQTAPSQKDMEQMITVQTASEGIVQMELNTYITRVLLGEVPADFEKDALMAQAVAVRTYTLKNRKHESACVCTDPACCQAYCTEEAYLASGHTQQQMDKIQAAVYETDEFVLTYDDALIDATYFSCSGGRTEAALAVWGSAVPYLQSVDSPGEENAAHYIDTISFNAETFQKLLDTDLQGSPGSWIGRVTYTDGGGVDTMEIGGTLYNGTELRQLLNLRSTAFVMHAVGDTITVTTKGYGHRVGMSQYGADAMATAGSSYEEILAHYYPGTELEKYNAITN